LAGYDPAKILIYKYGDLCTGDFGKPRQEFLQRYSAFRSKPSLELARKLQKLAAESLNPCEILGADVASGVLGDRSEFSQLLAKRMAESKRNTAIVYASLKLIFQNNRGKAFEGFMGSGNSLGFVEPYELDEEVLMSCPAWVQALALVDGYGYPFQMRKLSRVSSALAAKSGNQVKILLVCAEELGAYGELTKPNGPRGKPAFTESEFQARNAKRMAMFRRILQLDPDCDIALWTIGLDLYYKGQRQEGRKMILRAYELLKRRPNAKDYTDLVRDWISKNP
jgi:hypothetical protein